MFRETASGAKLDRALLRKALEQIDASDLLMVIRLDRMARSTRDLLNTLATVADRKAGFRSLGDAWADTTSPHGRLMLTVLGGLAEFERELIRARTGEGWACAKARGAKMGQLPKLILHQIKEALRRRDAGEPMRDIARTYKVSHRPTSRLVARAGNFAEAIGIDGPFPRGLSSSWRTSGSANQQAQIGRQGAMVRQKSTRAGSFASGS